jgi:nucleotide-binding universal stress UspA family protein
MSMKRIVVAVDRSEPSLRAVDAAAELAGKYGAELSLVMVVRDLPGPDPGREVYARTEHINESEEVLALDALRGRLDEICDRAVSKGAPKTNVDVLTGDAAEELIAYARDGQADLLVMGSRGHGRLVGLLLGSVVQKLVGLAPCPVLVVH